MAVHTSKSLQGSIYPAFWGERFAAYANAGGFILARIDDGASCYFQPGDESAVVAGIIDEAPTGDGPAVDASVKAFDEWAANYADLMEAPEVTGGRPSSDGGFWYWLRH